MSQTTSEIQASAWASALESDLLKVAAWIIGQKARDDEAFRQVSTLHVCIRPAVLEWNSTLAANNLHFLCISSIRFPTREHMNMKTIPCTRCTSSSIPEPSTSIKEAVAMCSVARSLPANNNEFLTNYLIKNHLFPPHHIPRSDP